MDFGRSDDQRVQAQLDRLSKLSVPQGRLGLETIRAVLGRLGDPHKRLPPVFHVAGTNGKGSTCAFLRAMLEADGKTVHATISPHLVRYNERIRVAGNLIEDRALAPLLEEVLDASEDLGPSFFETTIAAAFLAFSREPADACVIEVGLGGRFDATNVLEPEALAVCGIAALGLDHERFLLAPEKGVPKQPMARIGFEKAGIAKRDVPLVTMGDSYPEEAQAAIRDVANAKGAILLELGHEWDCADTLEHLFYRDKDDPDSGLLFDPPILAGSHQISNAGLAIAMLRAQSQVSVSKDSIQRGLRTAKWPARLQQLSEGPLTVLANDKTVWLDGGHNPNAGRAIAEFFDDPIHLVVGMLDNKDPVALTAPLGDKIRSLTAVPVEGFEYHPAKAFGDTARAASDLEDALLNLPSDGFPVLIAGSLYLAGDALRLNHQLPD